MIPKSVEHKDLLKALEPLLELLGTDANHVYSTPPMVIDHDSVTFCTVPDGTKLSGQYPEGVPAGLAHPQDAEAGELVCPIRVLVTYRG